MCRQFYKRSGACLDVLSLDILFPFVRARQRLGNELVVSMTCSLCLGDSIREFYLDEKRNWLYFECQQCALVFRDASTYLSHEDEKQRYLTHNNSIENQGYVDFLTPNVSIVLPYLSSDCRGLDYGCGPGPIMDQLFARHGIEVKNYDPHFAPHAELLKQNFDFVTCTEVFEHFYEPYKEMETLHRLLKPGGFLVLMTELRKDKDHFANWGYRTDNTHVVFLNHQSLHQICAAWNYELKSSDGRISLLRKKL